MAHKQFKEIKELTVEELNSKVRVLEKEIFESRIQLATGQLANPAGIWLKRKNLARCKMLIGEKAKAQ